MFVSRVLASRIIRSLIQGVQFDFDQPIIGGHLSASYTTLPDAVGGVEEDIDAESI
jgi:hypothetical protein